MNRDVHCMSLVFSTLIAVAAFGCSSASPGSGETEPMVTTQSKVIDEEDCLVGSVNGKVGICHATASTSNPYVHIRVSTNACVNAHTGHLRDFVSADSACPVCGNGVIESGETCDPTSSCPTSCDDGDACTIDQLSGGAAACNASCSHAPISACNSGDGCCPAGCSASSDSDCAPPCNPVRTIQKLKFYWLGRSCGAAQPPDVVFTLNEVEVARVPLANSCDCTPGVGSVEVTDPSLLALGQNGVNVFRVTTTGEISWGTVAVETPAGGGEFTIWAAWPFGEWNNATNHPENLCEVGVQNGLGGSGLAMNLSGGVNCGN